MVLGNVSLMIVGLDLTGVSLWEFEKVINAVPAHLIRDFRERVYESKYGAGVLSTCNRFETYLLSDITFVEDFADFLRELGVDRRRLYIRLNGEVVRYLIEVACGPTVAIRHVVLNECACNYLRIVREVFGIDGEAGN